MAAIYLDHAATTPVRRDVLEAAWPWLTTEFGNPSSQHEHGTRAAYALAAARLAVAEFLGSRASEITFTSGGTEANNLAIIGLSLANPRGRHIVSAATEHEAVLESIDYLVRHHDFDVTWLPVDGFGRIEHSLLERTIRPDTTLVSLMLANNEIGTIHPIREIVKIAHDSGALVHTDAVQGVGWLDLNVETLGVDSLSISGHKFGAPKGIGAVFIKSRLAVEPLIHGGGQEFGRRSGTENVAWAVGLATALRALPDAQTASNKTAVLRDELVAQVLELAPRAIYTGPQLGSVDRLASIASFCFEGCSGEALLIELERLGIVCSSGSACAAGRDEPSHVLLALGLDYELAQTSVRFSLARETSQDDIRATVSALGEALRNLGQ
jgi:cysteine desulfurase